MHLAPLAPTLNAVLARLPFAIAEELDPGAVHEQVQRAICPAVGNLHGQGLLPAAQRRKVRHGPVQPRQLQQARHHASRLAKRQLEQDLDRQAELDGRIGKHRWPSGSPVTWRAPGHVIVDPDQQRSTLPKRCVVTGPVRRARAGGRRLAHAVDLKAWIQKVNPPTSDFCKNAGQHRKSKGGIMSVAKRHSAN